jgi:anti-sigma factor RsiW
MSTWDATARSVDDARSARPSHHDMLLSDLDWQAYCYVAGDLPADAALAFEQRLAEDLAACEAVARMSELFQAVQAALAIPPRSTRSAGPVLAPRKQGLSQAKWMALAATLAGIACGAWLLGTGLLGTGFLNSGMVSGPVALQPLTGEQRALVDAWIETASPAPAAIQALDEREPVLLAEIEDESALVDSTPPQHTIEVPGWLTAALTETEG